MSAVEVDCVAKFDGQPLARNNRIMAQEVFNQHCALAPALESILLVLASKIVLQHNHAESGQSRTDANDPKRTSH